MSWRSSGGCCFPIVFAFKRSDICLLLSGGTPMYCPLLEISPLIIIYMVLFTHSLKLSHRVFFFFFFFFFLNCCIAYYITINHNWAAPSEFVSSSIPSWQILTAHAQPFSGARDLAFCLKVPLDSLLLWASSGGSGETARMRRLAWTFAARIGDKYRIRLTRSNYNCVETVWWCCRVHYIRRKPLTSWHV